MLKNARTEYHNEFEEIGFYAGIESFADTVGDKDTAKLARGIRREEERMAKFLERQIEQLAKAVAREEVPAAERNGGSRRSLEPAPLVEQLASARASGRARASRSRRRRARSELVAQAASTARRPGRAASSGARRRARSSGGSRRRPRGSRSK